MSLQLDTLNVNIPHLGSALDSIEAFSPDAGAAIRPVREALYLQLSVTDAKPQRGITPGLCLTYAT